MASVYLTPAHEAFRRELRQRFARDVLPNLEEWERRRKLPREIWQTLGTAGLFGLHQPRRLGGSARDLFHSVVLLEELGRTGYAGFRVAVAVHAYMATASLAMAGSDELKQRYLAPAIAGQKVAALALTEPDAGSDLGRLQTSAVRDGGSYVVRGTKRFVANGTTADFVTVAVRTGPTGPPTRRGASGLSLLIVDTASPGVSVRRLENLGWHCSDTAELRFDDVRVPADNLIGSANRGFVYLMQGLQLERLVAGILALGGLDHCLALTARYVTSRRIFDGTLGKLPVVRQGLADLLTEAEATRQLAYHAAWSYQRGDLPMVLCSMVKLKATELASRAAHQCMQLFGAHGYQEGSEIARIYRDVQAATVAGGPSEVMRELIAQATFEEGLGHGLAAADSPDPVPGFPREGAGH